MKKFLFISFLCLSFLFKLSYAQVMYTDDFDSYTVGQGIATQSTTWWNTWSGNPGSAEDPTVSDSFAFSAANSVRVFGSNDGVIELNDLTSNRYRIEFYFYIPSGKQAYYNLMQNFNPTGTGNVWGMQIFFQNGTVEIDGGGAAAASFSYPSDTWIKIQHFIDLDNDWADIYVNDTLVHAYKWSNGTFNDGSGINKLDAINFYAWNVGGVNEYYLDNFLIEQVPSPDPAQNLSLQIVNNNDVALNWNSPANDTPLHYAVARDGQIIAIVNNDSAYTDLNLYPNSYNYDVFAYYGTNLGYSSGAGDSSVTIAGGNQRQRVLFEIFTGTWCGYCPTAARALTLMDNQNALIAEINYHGGDSYETAATNSRASFYSPLLFNNETFGYPGSVINGMYGFAGALPSVNEHRDLYLYYYDKYMNVPAIYTIAANVTNVTGTPYQFDIDVTVEETFHYFNDEMTLMVCLTETNIPENWGGLTVVKNVLRKTYPNINGTILDFSSSSTVNNSFTLELEANYNPINTKAVIFVQNKITGHVMEAKVIDLGALVNNINDTPENAINIFPNPAQNYVTIAFDGSSQNKQIEIIDITGRIIDTFNLSPLSNQLVINTAHYYNGTYLCRFKSDDNSISNITKIIILK